MKTLLLCGLVVALFGLASAGAAKADTITDTTLNVVYTATSSQDASDAANEYDVTLKIDATGFSQGTGFLTSVAMQFSGAKSVTLESATGGTSAWSAIQPGGLNSGGCDGHGNFVCTQNLSANLPVAASGIYTFVFDVTNWLFAWDPAGQPGSDSDIKAAYNTKADNSGKNLGLTSQGIGIGSGTNTSVPEPGSLPLLAIGLTAVLAFAGRKLAAA